jgi:hypothetical protein
VQKIFEHDKAKILVESRPVAANKWKASAKILNLPGNPNPLPFEVGPTPQEYPTEEDAIAGGYEWAILRARELGLL